MSDCKHNYTGTTVIYCEKCKDTITSEKVNMLYDRLRKMETFVQLVAETNNAARSYYQQKAIEILEKEA
jgi:hypothetical protein